MSIRRTLFLGTLAAGLGYHFLGKKQETDTAFKSEAKSDTKNFN